MVYFIATIKFTRPSKSTLQFRLKYWIYIWLPSTLSIFSRQKVLILEQNDSNLTQNLQFCWSIVENNTLILKAIIQYVESPKHFEEFLLWNQWESTLRIFTLFNYCCYLLSLLLLFLLVNWNEFVAKLIKKNITNFLTNPFLYG